MNLTLLSINHKLTPVEVRERLDVPERQQPAVLAELRRRCRLDELLLISTCNRVEFVFLARDEVAALAELHVWMRERLGGIPADLERDAIVLSQRAALIHLFRVACSLESMVIGEPQILGQVKDAYELAVREQSAGPALTALLPRVFRAAKRVRGETQVARFAVSISHAAVELAIKIFETLADKTVLVIGAGEMAELAVTHLRKRGIAQLLVTNRTFARAVELSEKFQGRALPFDRLDAELPGADIVISSTGARGYIIHPEQVRQALKTRKGSPMFFIDIAVPRDIDPAINGLSGAYCYDIDDLNGVIDAHRREREREALKAQHIVEDEVRRFEGWFASLSAVPAVKALRQRFHEIGESELDKALAQLSGLPPKSQQQVRRLVHALVNKLLHAPSTSLRQLAEQGHGQLLAEALAQLFELSLPEAQGRTASEAGDRDAEVPAANVLRLPLKSSS
jgi:glutamyl-tRNA reductase